MIVIAIPIRHQAIKHTGAEMKINARNRWGADFPWTNRAVEPGMLAGAREPLERWFVHAACLSALRAHFSSTAARSDSEIEALRPPWWHLVSQASDQASLSEPLAI